MLSEREADSSLSAPQAGVLSPRIRIFGSQKLSVIVLYSLPFHRSRLSPRGAEVPAGPGVPGHTRGAQGAGAVSRWQGCVPRGRKPLSSLSPEKTTALTGSGQVVNSVRQRLFSELSLSAQRSPSCPHGAPRCLSWLEPHLLLLLSPR